MRPSSFTDCCTQLPIVLEGTSSLKLESDSLLTIRLRSASLNSSGVFCKATSMRNASAELTALTRMPCSPRRCPQCGQEAERPCRPWHVEHAGHRMMLYPPLHHDLFGSQGIQDFFRAKNPCFVCDSPGAGLVRLAL